ncbi:hypothetical protein HMPREF9104_01560 [Lentilactobacillus kisonensis F0435]|uniref:Uncharacterized protein n=1 Tax=Lentilactobacillus kisonensis F0435 TaxID=797516 RepID=H1LG34_9LACO|nr:hypothetical protein HMPREF9104_01560 [Lentilactobacillus kisonensis F0435]
MHAINQFKNITVEEKKIVGGGHCYTASCIRQRDSFLPNVAHGVVCQAIGVCS